MNHRYSYKRPWLYPLQEAAFFNSARISLVEASTKAGKTVAGIAWLFEKAFQGKAGQNFWWVAPIFPQAKIAFTRMLQAVPADMVVSARNTDLTVSLRNGAIISFKSGEKPDGLYGEDVYAAVIDEASRLREEAWHAVRSTLTATRGPVRLVGNVKGRRNFFYQLARRAEAGEPNMAYTKITAADAVAAGILDTEEVESARSVLPGQVFRELYLAEPSDDQGNPFGIDQIEACIGPLSSAPPVCWGWDLAKSVDWTVGIALDRNGRCCRFLRFQKPWFATTAMIIRETGNTPALIDSSGVGDPIAEQLQRQLGSRFEGYKFTAQSKQQLMEGLAMAMGQGEISYPDGPIVVELRSFEYEYTRFGVRYAAADGAHDDCVCALALAVMRKGSRKYGSYDSSLSWVG